MVDGVCQSESMTSTQHSAQAFQQSLAAVARGRYLVPIVLAVGIAAIGVNESIYRQSRESLSNGIALTEARMRAAQTLQLLTDAGLYARSYVLAGVTGEAAGYRDAINKMYEAKKQAFDLIAKLDESQSIPVEGIDALVTAHVRAMENWVELVARSQREAAIQAAFSRESLLRRQQLRDEFGKVLDRAAQAQQNSRNALFQSMSLSRLAVHVLALITMLGMVLFRRQLRLSDEQLAGERLLLSERVKTRTAELTEMASHLVGAREDERAHIARELHDELGGVLTATKLEFARLRRMPNLPDAVLQRIAAIDARLSEGIAVKRRVIENLRPSSLDQLGLVSAIEILCRDMAGVLGVPVRTDLSEVNVEKSAELSLYRVAQESLTNIAKYARCTQVQVRLTQIGSRVQLTVQDDGQGFLPDRLTPGRHGLAGMRMRLEAHGGRLIVVSAPGNGATIKAEVPVVTENA